MCRKITSLEKFAPIVLVTFYGEVKLLEMKSKSDTDCDGIVISLYISSNICSPDPLYELLRESFLL